MTEAASWQTIVLLSSCGTPTVFRPSDGDTLELGSTPLSSGVKMLETPVASGLSWTTEWSCWSDSLDDACTGLDSPSTAVSWATCPRAVEVRSCMDRIQEASASLAFRAAASSLSKPLHLSWSSAYCTSRVRMDSLARWRKAC